MVMPVATPMAKVAVNSFSQKQEAGLVVRLARLLYQRRPEMTRKMPAPRLMGTNRKW